MEKLVINNLEAVLSAMARLPSCRSLPLGESAFLLATGTEAASENWAFVRSRSLEGGEVARARSFFDNLGLPFVWPVFPNAGRAYRRALEEGGLFPRGELTAMARAVCPLERAHSPLVFEKAGTEKEAAAWAETAWQAFGSPPGAPVSFVSMARGLAAEAGFLLTTARRGAVPVGTFMLASRGSGAGLGVYYFATLPEERGKGVARAMMDEILNVASDGSFGSVVLQATPEGARFYATRGFGALFPIPLYSSAQDVY